MKAKNILWKNANAAIFALKQKNSGVFDVSLFDNSAYFVLSFPFASQASQEVLLLPGLRGYYSGDAKNWGFALWMMSDQESLERVAQLVHNHHDGFPCGRIEHLSGLSLAQNSSMQDRIKPIYDEHIKPPTIAALMNLASAANLKGTVSSLVNQGTRGHTTSNGLATPNLIQDLIEAVAADIPGLEFSLLDSSPDITSQKNLVVSIPGTTADDGVVIVGAHMDTILGRDPAGVAPGADDDASGIAVMVELLRIIAENDLKFSRRIEFHAYGAEEIGLVGSKALANSYKLENKKIAGMLQFDMVSFTADSDDLNIYLVSNNTSSVLRRSLKTLLLTYLDGGFSELPLAGGTSDHKAWYDMGYPAVFPFENPLAYNTRIHTSGDTIDNSGNFQLAVRFANLGMAYLAHYAGLNSAADEYEVRAQEENLLDDIKIAILPSHEPENPWLFLTATPQSIAKMEFCRVSEGNGYRCIGELSPLELTRKSENRAFFASTNNPVLLSEGDSFALFAYDEQEYLLARRIISLSSK